MTDVLQASFSDLARACVSSRESGQEAGYISICFVSIASRLMELCIRNYHEVEEGASYCSVGVNIFDMAGLCV